MELLKAVCIVLLCTFVTEVSSNYCYRQGTTTVKCTQASLEYYAEKYTTKCGVFNWSRCTKYRQKSRYKTITRLCTAYIQERICCEGWSGPTCDIHNEAPIVEFCPGDKIITATGKGETFVTWDKPFFKEPYGFDMSITSTYKGESAELTWGVHKVKYTAKSLNNNKEVQCSFTVDVRPPLPVAQVQGHSDGEVFEVKEGDQMTFLCYAEYGDPAMTLEWFMNNNTKITNGSRFYVEDSDHLHYKNSFNELTLTFHKSHDNLECRGWQYDNEVTHKVTLYFNVDYDLPPSIQYCPPDQVIITEENDATTRWGLPHFLDHKGENLTVSCNLPGVNETLPTYKFNWGDNKVVYTARNPRSGLESICEFIVSVQTKRCKPLSMPEGGALVCGSWSSENTQICSYMCEASYDIQLTKYVAPVYICSSAGVWLPTPQAISCSRRRITGKDRMPSSRHYYTGDCDLSRVKDNIKNATIEIIQNSIVNDICKYDSCTSDHLKVKC